MTKTELITNALLDSIRARNDTGSYHHPCCDDIPRADVTVLLEEVYRQRAEIRRLQAQADWPNHVADPLITPLQPTSCVLKGNDRTRRGGNS